ncbi:hypothetical protein GCM10010976_01890 [Bizionia arctica]|uniref:Uncharacterized protein n=1 Tax=Bizionia arctica TaxID=1495645 RepID=A0A917LK23_9FLAO|nr:hypothetical protein GCM10010976_01890 [Bizionia arctica]
MYLTVVGYREEADMPITFKKIPSEKGIFTFENPKHAFPTRISYSNPETNAIHAWIEGTIEGELRKMDFNFKRE